MILTLISFLLLQQQHLIELIRRGSLEGALDYAQTHLAERGEENSEILPELERTLALLAFENPESSPFADLMHPSQRQKVRYDLLCTMYASTTFLMSKASHKSNAMHMSEV